MKILNLHCDYINFKPLRKALKNIKTLSEKEKQGEHIRDALVVMTAVENTDTDIEKSAEELAKNIRETSKQLNTNKIVLYPYAHLSSNLANPDTAIKTMDATEKLLEKDFEIHRAPFGYYKEFELKVKGHPLAELSREIHPEINKETEPDIKNLLKSIGKTTLDRSKLNKNDHRIIAQEMDLFSFNEVAPGSIFWHKNGKIIYNELLNFSRELHQKSGYEEVSTPQILDNKLWKISGHWGHYQNNMFLTKYENRDAAVKPMNCPGMMLIYKSHTRSYKELPIRMLEFGLDHRKELSGVLSGLFRLIQFTQDDSHIFCTKEQIGGEIKKILELVKKIYEQTFNMEYRIELSTRPEKFMGEKKVWDNAEEQLKKVLKELNIKYQINEGDGAFYGPKIDIHIKDSLKRSWQLGTIQLDLQMPERFDLKYIDKKGKEQTPIVIHRAIFGALERFLGILLEHTNGRLPTWLAPIQVRVLSFTDKHANYAKQIIKKIGEEIPEIRLDADFRTTTVPSKVKDAELMRVPYIIVIGDREKENNTVALRIRGNKKIESMKTEEFINNLKEEIENRK